MRHRHLMSIGVLLVLVGITALTSAVEPVVAQSGPQPGTTDPMGQPSRSFLLRDDEIFAPGIVNSQSTGVEYWDYTYFTDGDLHIPSSIVNVGDPATFVATQDPQLWTASGRILSPSYDQVVSVNRTSPGWLGVSFVDKSAPSPIVSYYLNGIADRVYTSDLIDVGVGDLDKLEDSSNQYHDEVVVAYASGSAAAGYQVNVTVLDYTSVCSGGTSNLQPCGLVSATTSHGIDAFTNSSNWLLGYQDNVLGVAVGDFDANGRDEIAVAHVQNESVLWLTLFRYANNGQGARSVTEVAALNLGPAANNGLMTGAIALESGDFDGADSNADELVLGQVQSGFGSDVELVGYVSTIALSSALVPTVASSQLVFDIPNAPQDEPIRMELAPGLFQFDPASGFDFDRRQLAVAYNQPISPDVAQSYLAVTAYSVDSALQLSGLWANVTPYFADTGMRFSIAAGGYRGVANGTNPVWGVAYSVNFAAADASGNYEHLGTLDGATGARIQDMSVENHLYGQDLRMPLANYDQQGDSIYLGAPVHYTVDGVINTDFVLQEPPKHSYYDNNPNSATYGQVVTVSRKDEFNVQLQDSNQTTFSSTSTDTSSYDVGGSVAVSASATVSAGADIGIANVSGSVTTSFAASASYDYKANKSSYDKSYASRKVSFSGQTNRDDYLEGRTQIFDIWRYRIYGVTSLLPNGTTGNGFYEVVLPGPVEKFAGGGQSFDWYQPLHENGNILSYPVQLGTTNPVLPDDLGVYTDTQGVTVTAPLVPASQQAFDGTSGTIALQYTNTSGSGYIQGYSHNLTTSADISRSSKVTASVFGTGGTVQTSVKVGFNSAASFGKSSTSDQTTTNSTGITLNKTAGNANQAYYFSPIFYITEDGTVKAAQAVSVLGNPSGTAFWASIYGGKADPALNLPGRFNPVLSSSSNTLIGWQPDVGTTTSSNSNRKQLRGFSLHDPTLNPVTGVYDYLAYAPAAGDQVRVQSYVYNYSTGVGVSDLAVQFQAIPYNANDDVETPFTSCPRNLTLTTAGRCVIGQTTVASLSTAGAGNVAPAAITWDTTGFGASSASGSDQYRIYVVLDPNNTIDEIYETENPDRVYAYVDVNGQSRVLKRGIDPGQNNEGYGYATIASPNASLATAPPANVFLRADSLAVVDARSQQPSSEAAVVTTGVPARLRVTLFSTARQREYNDVLIYDGDPSAGGVLIAQQRVFAGAVGGASVWLTWQPATAGTHTLYAKVVKDHDDPRPDNGVDSLTVQVVAPRYVAYSPLISRAAATRTAQ